MKKGIAIGVFFLGGVLSMNGGTAVAQTQSVNLKRVEMSALPELPIDEKTTENPEAGSKELLKQSLLNQVARCKAQSGTDTWNFAGKAIPRSRYCIETANWFLALFEKGLSLNEVWAKAKNELEWYQSVGKPDTGEVQFTGYYFPVYRAKKKADAVFKYPVYGMPNDLVQVNVGGVKVWRRKVGNRYVPYYTREEIANGALRGRGLELGFLSNPVDPYILEVQGSGALLFDDGSGKAQRQIVNYGGQNGYTYVSLGKLMRAAGIPEIYISLQGIQKYFTEVHPEEWPQFSNQNPTFVFFKKDSIGPYGASNVVLTPKHSIAIDQKEFPMGAIGLVQTERPFRIEGDQAYDWRPFSQFVVAQDTGGAIKSPGRVDIFWGEGTYAEVTAGRTDRLGSLFFALVPSDRFALSEGDPVPAPLPYT